MILKTIGGFPTKFFNMDNLNVILETPEVFQKKKLTLGFQKKNQANIALGSGYMCKL